MNWNEYRALAIRTESIPANSFGMLPTVEVTSMYETAMQNEKATRLLHAALGLCTELNEQESGDGTVNYIEEAGDVLWYLAILDDVVDWMRFPSLAGIKPTHPINFYVGEIQDVVKRHIFYGTEINLDRLRMSALMVFHKLESELARHDIDIALAMEANIRKLEKRFPDKMFTSQAAIHRDVDRELDHILESGELIPKVDTILELGEAPTVYKDIDQLLDEVELTEAKLSQSEWKAFVLECLSTTQIERMAMDLVTEKSNYYHSLGADELARAYGALYRTYSSRRDKLEDSTVWVIWNELGYSLHKSEIRNILQRWT